jgi:hypothetical protein
MKNKISLLVSGMVLLALVSWGCGNQVNGCTDPLASNYDPDATNDDGSCQYNTTGNNSDQARIIIWFDENASVNFLQVGGISSFEITVDGIVEGTHNMSVIDVSEPVCGAPNHVTVTKTVPNGQLQYFPYYMVSQAGDTAIQGSFGFIGGRCIPYQIPY